MQSPAGWYCVYDLQLDLERENFVAFDLRREIPFKAMDIIKERFGENSIRLGLNKYEEHVEVNV